MNLLLCGYVERIRARHRAGRPGLVIFDPGFFDPEKNLIFNPEPGPDFKFSPKTGPDPEFRVRVGFFAGRVEKPGPARKNSKIQKLKKNIKHKIQFTTN